MALASAESRKDLSADALFPFSAPVSSLFLICARARLKSLWSMVDVGLCHVLSQ